MTDRTILVTGATGAIGRAVATALARPDHALLLHYHQDRAAAETLAAELSGRASTATPIGADLSTPAGVEAVLDAAQRKGPVSVLISNAALLRPAAVSRIRPDDWSAMVNLNLTAALMLIRGLLPGMVDAGYGRIVVTSSVAGLCGWPFQAGYAATKAGLLGMVKAAAKECARFGVTANAVAPGYVPSAMSEQGGPGARAAIMAQTPMARPGTAEEVAAAIAFLASPAASYITGQVLAVDGGMSA
jgi:3-oxoacyl-[acyl-carrier protein] reductase